jgi:hypothetical protein
MQGQAEEEGRGGCTRARARAYRVQSRSDSMAHAHHAHEAPARPFRSAGNHAGLRPLLKRESGHDGGTGAKRRRAPDTPG